MKRRNFIQNSAFLAMALSLKTYAQDEKVIKMLDDNFTLANGIKIPKLGLGTWRIGDDEVVEVVENAIKIGYKHIDTAQAYANERGVAEGVRKSGIKREDIFITSKVAAEHKTYKDAADSIDETLKKMNLDYLDLMIIHSPQPWKLVNQSNDRFLEGNKEAWRALEDAYKAGKLKAIGVSNFLEQDLDNILNNCEIKPMVNQILAHISNTPLALINYCKEKKILVEAYSPIAHGEALKNPQIKAVADKYKVSIPALCIRYVLQLGLVALPKSRSLEHLKENTAVDFEISSEDMLVLQNMEKIKDYGEHSYFPVFGGKM